MLNPLAHIRQAPAMLDAVVAIAGHAVGDLASLRNGLPGDDIDEWDPDYVRRALPLLGPLYRAYFRGDVRGLENIPEEGPALLVGNHSGGIMIADTFLFTMAFYEHFGPERRFHQLAHDMAARMPGIGIRPFGTVRASQENARAAFEKGAPVLVYPGGDYETFRPSWHSDRIEFGGRKGFVKLALEQNVPIVPVVSIGGQESGLFVTRGQRAARLVKLPDLARIKVLPVSIGPPFGVNLMEMPFRVPLPAKITIQVMPPVDLEDRFGPEPDPDQVYEEVTGDMQDVLGALSEERSVPFLG